MIIKTIAKCFCKYDKAALFAGGVLFGTAGLSILGSKDAKKVYTEATAAALRAQDCVMNKYSVIRENADDILAEAKEINERRAQEAIIEDEAKAAEAQAEAEPAAE